VPDGNQRVVCSECAGGSAVEESCIFGEGEFEENGSEGKPDTPASSCGEARCMGVPQCGTAIRWRLPTSAVKELSA
jgi:hypothetical protein